MRLLIVVAFLLLSSVGCDEGPSPAAQGPGAGNVAGAVAGMSKYEYLAADGGPHMLLPIGAAGVDYGRACAVTANAQMAPLPVGSTAALIFADPPMTAWGTSADGLVEVYYLTSWTGMNLDALVAKATAALPTGSLTDTGTTFKLDAADAFLMFAGDTPASSAYGTLRVTIPAGTYQVLTGTFAALGESVTVYRLKPKGV